MNNPIPFPAVLLPHAPGLLLEDALQRIPTLIVVLRSTTPTALCPVCQQPSARIHSHDERNPTDLPWGGTPLRLLLRVREFFCPTPACPRRVFTERLPGVIAPSARTTFRLTALLHAIAFALGGEAGARLARQVSVHVSPATLINLIRRAPSRSHVSPQVLGVDDWAQRKGIRYGTALVDLERIASSISCRIARRRHWRSGSPRTTASRSSPGSPGAYATGSRLVRRGYSGDRWHLRSNWHEAIERVFNRYRSLIKQVAIVKSHSGKQPAAKMLPPNTVNRRRKYAEEQRARVQTERLALYTLIRERHAKGEYLTTIARDLKINYKTAHKYALADECPMLKAYPPRQRLLTPYEPYLRARWAEGCRNGQQLHREIVAHGFRGTCTLVASFVAQLRRAERAGMPVAPLPRAGDPFTPHTAAMLLLRRPER